MGLKAEFLAHDRRGNAVCIRCALGTVPSEGLMIVRPLTGGELALSRGHGHGAVEGGPAAEVIGDGLEIAVLQINKGAFGLEQV